MQSSLRGRTPYFTTKALDFGTRKHKRLKALRLQGCGEVTVTVRCGETEHSYPLTFVDGQAQTRLMGRGREFVLTFELKPWASVENMEIDFTVEG